jgi:hypothetical protein
MDQRDQHLAIEFLDVELAIVGGLHALAIGVAVSSAHPADGGGLTRYSTPTAKPIGPAGSENRSASEPLIVPAVTNWSRLRLKPLIELPSAPARPEVRPENVHRVDDGGKIVRAAALVTRPSPVISEFSVERPYWA